MALWSLTDSRGLSFYNKKTDIIEDVGKRLLEDRFVEVKTRKSLPKDKKWLENRPYSVKATDHSLVDKKSMSFEEVIKMIDDIEQGEWKDVSKEIIEAARKINIEKIERLERERARDLKRKQELQGEVPLTKKELKKLKRAEKEAEETLQDNEPIAQPKLTRKELRAARKAEKQALKNRELEELENEIEDLENEIEDVLVSEED